MQSLLAEVLDAAKARHKNDLASDIHVMTHIFLDLDRLAGDFMSTRQQLKTFTQALTASCPSLTLTDCGRQDVDAKMKGSCYYALLVTDTD